MFSLRRLGFILSASLLVMLGLAGCGGSDPATPERTAQRMRQSAALPSDYEAPVQQLYIAYFGRPADAGGLANFKTQLAGIGVAADARALNAAYADNPALKTLVNSFASSPESQALYTGNTADFVQAIYVNLLNRAPPANDEGKAFWVSAIDNGGLSRAKAAVSILAGALDNKTPQGLADAQVILNKTNNSSVFTATVPSTVYQGDAAAATARTMLGYITSTTTDAGFRATIDATIEKLTRQAAISVFTGTYSGTYDGYDQGTYEFTVAPDGTITGSGKSNTLGLTLVITGTLGNASGTAVQLAGTIGPLTFTATLSSDGALVGNWSGLGMSGTLRADRIQH